VLEGAFAAAKKSAEVEVYPAAHGWCPPDTTVYDKDQSERAWNRMLAMFEKALA
jgi:carboxymethylenebutenolidase